ncbi:MAG: hypothetical protein GYA48_07780 [Chloroflexi bacterium]|nr:hypothetical protein [Chloroflexota bacterium]
MGELPEWICVSIVENLPGRNSEKGEDGAAAHSTGHECAYRRGASSGAARVDLPKDDEHDFDKAAFFPVFS